MWGGCVCVLVLVCVWGGGVVGWWGGGVVGVGGALAAEVQTSAMAVTLALANPVASVFMVHSFIPPVAWIVGAYRQSLVTNTCTETGASPTSSSWDTFET